MPKTSEYFYKIADLNVATNTKKYLSDNFKLFEEGCASEKDSDLSIIFDDNANKMYHLMQDTVNEKLLLYTSFMSLYEASDHYTLVTYNDVKVVGIHILKNEKTGVIYTDDSEVPRGAHVRANELGLTEEDLFTNAFREVFFFYAQQYGRIAIHSASIKYRDCGYVFSGCSGAGKSTHVAMWAEAGIDFDIIDGDIAVIFEKNGEYLVAGLPWCGTSEAYSSICVPLKGIYFIRKAPENEVRSLRYVDSVLNVNAESLSPNWTKSLMELTLTEVEKVCRKVEVAELFCRADKEAAEKMRRHIEDRNRSK